MYQVSVRRDFVAQHYLVGGDWGAENEKHSHHYRIELTLEGEKLDQHGFLVDIVEIERLLDAQVAGYQDQTLNDKPAFASLNPSIEHFARILCHDLAADIAAGNVTALAVTIWENDIGWARYRLER